VFLLGVVGLLGCAAQRGDRDAALHRAAHQTRELERRFGVVTDRGANVYLAGLVSRLTESYPQRFAGRSPPSVIILNAIEPIAVSPGNGKVLLSRGLIFQLSNEAELAFILAHELGHTALGHLPPDGVAPEERRALEIGADSFGVGLMALAGYDPRPAVQALAHLHRTTSGWTTDPSYPDFTNRLATLQTAIYSSGWQPPGTIDRRDFHKLQTVLCAHAPRAPGSACGRQPR